MGAELGSQEADIARAKDRERYWRAEWPTARAGRQRRERQAAGGEENRGREAGVQAGAAAAGRQDAVRAGATAADGGHERG